MNRNRFALAEFAIHETEFGNDFDAIQEPLGNLIRATEVTDLRRGAKDENFLGVPIQLHLENSTSANVGRTLLDLDVELRRCAAYLEGGLNQTDP